MRRKDNKEKMESQDFERFILEKTIEQEKRALDNLIKCFWMNTPIKLEDAICDCKHD